MAASEPRAEAFAQLRNDLVRRFPGVVGMGVQATQATAFGSPHHAPAAARGAALVPSSPFAWVECGLGEGGLAWLAAWTMLRLAEDPLGRPALWVDTHGTLTPGDLLDLQDKLVVVRPADPHEAHVAADVALRTGSFSLVALEMHRALHPKPLARLARLAAGRRVGAGDALTPVVLWGEPPSFVAPPSGLSRTPFGEAIHALYEALAHACGERLQTGSPAQHSPLTREGARDDILPRRPHTTDRLRPMDRAADRRPPPSAADDVARRASRSRMDEPGDREPARARGSLYPVR